ncbi:MAG: YfiR family protein [Desulfobacterales bacterium]|nr:YfiR family protein [Desulfobacterales bacterium]
MKKSYISYLICAILLVHADTFAYGIYADLLESDVKANFIFYFSKFVNWPKNKLNPALKYIDLCVHDADSFAPHFSSLKQKTVQKYELRLLPFSDTHTCHLLYINTSDEVQIKALLKIIDKQPVLTIGESENFCELGGMIRFYKQNNKIRFEINMNAAMQANIEISSQLLKIAKIYHPN